MRGKLFLTLAASVSLAGGALASGALAAPVDGLWRTPVKNAEIQVYDCGTGICGRVVDSDDLRANPDMRDRYNKAAALQSRPIKGLVMMSNFKPNGSGGWDDGTLYDPSTGNTYHGSVTLRDANHLDLKGCIIFPLCRTQTWTRVR